MFCKFSSHVCLFRAMRLCERHLLYNVTPFADDIDVSELMEGNTFAFSLKIF